MTSNCDLLSNSRRERISSKISTIEYWIKSFNNYKSSGSKTIGDLLRSNSQIVFPSEFLSTSNEIQSEVLYRVKYEGYLKREINNISKFNNIDKVLIPKSFKYEGLPGLRHESIEKLTSILPLTLGQASRIPGVNPQILMF